MSHDAADTNSHGFTLDHVLLWTGLFPDPDKQVRGMTEMTGAELTAVQEMLAALGADEFDEAHKRFGDLGRKRNPGPSRTLSYQQFHELADGAFKPALISQVYNVLLNYGTDNPDRLTLLCPYCGKNLAENCGEVSIYRWKNDNFPVIDRTSLFALTARLRKYGPSSIWRFGDRSLELVEYVLQQP